MSNECNCGAPEELEGWRHAIDCPAISFQSVEEYRIANTDYHPEDEHGHDPYNYVGPKSEYRQRDPIKRVYPGRFQVVWNNIKFLLKYDLDIELV